MAPLFIQQTSAESLLCQVLCWALGTEQGAAEAKLRQAPGCSGTYILFKETVNKQVGENIQTGKSQMETTKRVTETAWGVEGMLRLSSQGGPLGGGDPGLRTDQEVASW